MVFCWLLCFFIAYLAGFEMVLLAPRHAFIGLGFEDRNDAFDFNCTLSDFKSTWIDREKEGPLQLLEHCDSC